MAFESILRKDILDKEITESGKKIKISVENSFDFIVNSAIQHSALVTPGSSKNIVETLDLIEKAIVDYQKVTQVNEGSKVNVVYEKPDMEMDIETIAFNFVSRTPGAFSKSRPNEGRVKNRKPILREITADPDNPGYQRAVLGYFYDNTLSLTAWARTNKAATKRAIWIENLMEEYAWFFTSSGVSKILYEGWGKSEHLNIRGNKYYGRPVNYFLRTEKLWNLSQKTLEEVHVRLATVSS